MVARLSESLKVSRTMLLVTLLAGGRVLARLNAAATASNSPDRNAKLAVGAAAGAPRASRLLGVLPGLPQCLERLH